MPLERQEKSAIRRMMQSIEDRHIGQRERIDALEATHVVAILVGIGAALVVGVDATDRAEIMPCSSGLELVEREVLGAADDMQTIEGY